MMKAPIEPPAEPANPPLADVQQLEAPPLVIPVRIEGPVAVRPIPARSGPSFPIALTSVVQKILDYDLKRSAVTLVSSTAWTYRHKPTGQDCPVPANVPLVLTHCDAAYALTTDAAVLSVFTEIYAD